MRFLLVLLFLLTVHPSFSLELDGSVSQEEFFDCLEKINLSEVQRQRILKIRDEENFILRPLILDYHSKKEGLEFLNSLSCGFFDRECKIKLKEDIELREQEKNEALRKIEHKKAYYKIRYRNVLTRKQDIEIQALIKETEHKNKVLKEREERAKRQEILDKLNVFKRRK